MADRTSGLSKTANARRNTVSGRESMAATSFALPEQRKYRIDTLAHARNALARAAQYATPDEQKRIRAAVRKRWPSIDVG